MHWDLQIFDWYGGVKKVSSALARMSLFFFLFFVEDTLLPPSSLF